MKRKIVLSLSAVVYLLIVYGDLIGSPSKWQYRCYSIDVKPGIDVPPMPDCSENNKTIGGIDTDNDGVRDDIQRYIASIQLDNDFFKRGLQQYAKSQRMGLLESGDTSKAQRNFTKFMLAGDCALSASVDNMFRYSGMVSNLNLNTISRRVNNRIWNSKLEVQLVPSVPPEDACDFDINHYEGKRWR